MATSTNYKGYKVLTPEPAKEGGQDLNYNFKRVGDDVETINADLAVQPLVLTPVTTGNAIVIDDATDISTGDLRGTSAIDLQSSASKTNVNQVASGNYSAIVGGTENRASGLKSFVAAGESNVASGYTAHAEGRDTTASGIAAHSEGYLTSATQDYSHAEGASTTASDYYAHAEGTSTTASGEASHAEGYTTTASANHSHAEGNQSTASGNVSHAEGSNSLSSGVSAHAEGDATTASGVAAHSEGSFSSASGNYSHAEGEYTTASGINSHAEGYYTTASTVAAHAQGIFSYASLRGQSSQASMPGLQHSVFTLSNNTLDATPTVLYLDGGQINASVLNTLLPTVKIGTDTDNILWVFHAFVGAKNYANGDSAAYELKGAIKRYSNSVSIVGSVTVVTIAEDAGASAWDVTAIADDTNKSLAIMVTGALATSIAWAATVHVTELLNVSIELG